MTNAPSRLYRWCTAGMEAGWLVVLVVAPLFFNLYSQRSFEPDKVAWVRSLAWVVALMWGIRWLEAPRDTGTPRFGRGLRAVGWLVLLLFAGQVLSTAFSIAPRLSVWGSFERQQGLYTTAAYLVFFVAVWRHLRTPAQLQRLVTAAVLVSFPIAIYGVLQHFGTDPLPWHGEFVRRVPSTMGNAIFASAFLILTVPLGLYRLQEAARASLDVLPRWWRRGMGSGAVLLLVLGVVAWMQTPRGGTLFLLLTIGGWGGLAFLTGASLRTALHAGVYTVVVAAQLAAIVFTQSRGPFLGLMAGLFFFAVLAAAVYQRWKTILAITSAGVVLGAVVVLINVPGSPLSFVQEMPYVSRLTDVLSTSKTAQVRMLVWEGSVDTINAHPWRALVGYGPEAFGLAFHPHYDPALAHFENRHPDRAHNEFFDALVMTGGIGALLFYGLLLLLLGTALRFLGLIATRHQGIAFGGTCLVGMGGVVWLFRLLDGGWRFVGLAVPLGLLVGLLVFVIVQAVRQRRLPLAPPPLALLVVAVTALLIGHMVELHFSLAITATRTYFWIFAGVLAAVGSGTMAGFATAHPHEKLNGSGLLGGLVALMLGTLVYNFWLPSVDLFAQTSLVWLFALTALVPAVLVFDEAVAEPLRTAMRSLGWYAGTVGIAVLVFTLAYRGRWLRVEALDPALLAYALFLVLILGLLAVRLTQGPEARLAHQFRVWAYPLLIGVVMVAIYYLNLRPIQADVYLQQARILQRQNNMAHAMPAYRKAVALSPASHFYGIQLSRALVQQARANPQGREAGFQEAAGVLRHLNDLHPLHPDPPANLGRLYRGWAGYADNDTTRRARLEQAAHFAAEAVARSPGKMDLRHTWGQVLVDLERLDEARTVFEQTLALDSMAGPTYRYLGDLHRMQQQWAEAARSYEHALTLAPRDPISIHSALGFVYGQQGRLEGAIRQNQQVLALNPADAPSHRNLIVLYERMGACHLAAQQLRMARAVLADDEGLAPLAAQVAATCPDQEISD